MRRIRKECSTLQYFVKNMPMVLRTELEGVAHSAFKAVGFKIPPRLLSEPLGEDETVVVRF